jgi:hypothetical protein
LAVRNLWIYQRKYTVRPEISGALCGTATAGEISSSQLPDMLLKISARYYLDLRGPCGTSAFIPSILRRDDVEKPPELEGEM